METIGHPVCTLKHLVIVSGASSAVLYAEEAKRRDFVPILVNPPHRYCVLNDSFNDAIKDIGIVFNLKEEKEYASLIKKLKKYDIACVAAGGDGGVEYADRIARDLGLPGNDPETTWKRTTKKGMHDSLKKAGLRYTKSAVIKSEADIRKFWKSNKLKKGFVKFSRGAAAILNKAVFSDDDAVRYFNFIKEQTNIFGKGNDTDILLQEFVEGDEYIVDTVSCNGRHMVTDIWKYQKKLTANGYVANDSKRLVMSLEPEIAELIPYVYDALDATDVKFGPCHGEFKVDGMGPILIETNMRPIGMNMDAKYLDEILGHHVTDLAVDSYTDEDRFELLMKKPYKPLGYSLHKYCIVPATVDANPYPLKIILDRFKSFRQCLPEIKNEVRHFIRTDDLESASFNIKLNHRDWKTIEHELDILMSLENEFPGLIYTQSDVMYVPVKTDYKSLAKSDLMIENILIVANDGNYVWHDGEIKKASELKHQYDGMVFAYTKKESLAERMDRLMFSASLVRGNGRVTVIPEAYAGMPYGRSAAALILDVADVTVDIPKMDSVDLIVGWKN